MSVTYGFYNALNHDRLYNATEMSSIFDGLINDGIYESIGTAMMVTPSSGMTVNVGIGRAWFNHTWTLNDAILPVELSPSITVFSRIDAIVLKVDTRKTVRTNTIEVIEGTPATTPVKPSIDSGHSEVFIYPLAYVTIGAGITEITASNIENRVGMSETPFVTGIIQVMSIDTLIAQWRSQWEDWLNSKPAEFEEWVAQQKADMTDFINDTKAEVTSEHAAYVAWMDGKEDEFNDWFANLVYVLDGDVAGHLQNEIDDIIKQEFERFYSLTNKVTTIVDGVITEVSSEATCVTTVTESTRSKTIRTVVTPNEGSFKYIKMAIINDTTLGKEITESYTVEAKEV